MGGSEELVSAEGRAVGGPTTDYELRAGWARRSSRRRRGLSRRYEATRRYYPRSLPPWAKKI